MNDLGTRKIETESAQFLSVESIVIVKSDIAMALSNGIKVMLPKL